MLEKGWSTRREDPHLVVRFEPPNVGLLLLPKTSGKWVLSWSVRAYCPLWSSPSGRTEE